MALLAGRRRTAPSASRLPGLSHAAVSLGMPGMRVVISCSMRHARYMPCLDREVRRTPALRSEPQYPRIAVAGATRARCVNPVRSCSLLVGEGGAQEPTACTSTGRVQTSAPRPLTNEAELAKVAMLVLSDTMSLRHF